MGDKVSAADGYHIIVGGGLAGLFSARVLLDRGVKNICVVEKSAALGGYLKHTCARNPLGDGRDFTFDQGTHFVLSPKEGRVRDLIERDLDLSAYHSFEDSLQEGHVLNNNLYAQSGCAYIGALPVQTQTQTIRELEALHDAAEDHATYDNMQTLCELRYGATITQEIYAPAYQKFTGLPLNELPVSMQAFFVPSRVIAYDRAESLRLKQDADWDWRIAYADCGDSASDIMKYYPKSGGIGQWLNGVADSLRCDGVRILNETTLENLEMEEGGVIRNVVLSDGQVLPCAQLVWSLPAIFLAKMAGVAVPSQKPVMRHVELVHFITDQRPVERPYWVDVYDADKISYRITVYDNFAPQPGGHYRVTVEVLHGGDLHSGAALEEQVFSELKEMQILPDEAQQLWSMRESKSDGFPIISNAAQRVYQEQYDRLENTLENISLVGRRPDIGFGQIPILNHVLKELG